MLEHEEIVSSKLVLVSCTQAFTLEVALKPVLPRSSLNQPPVLVAFTFSFFFEKFACVSNCILSVVSITRPKPNLATFFNSWKDEKQIFLGHFLIRVRAAYIQHIKIIEALLADPTKKLEELAKNIHTETSQVLLGVQQKHNQNKRRDQERKGQQATALVELCLVN